ncbi:MAG: trigger factor [Neisseriaceae bacterium]|nr:trigger factor [Neisseriaceae bacterium]MBP6863297.1 trigger factor [Neisseriaceae bacterium]
MEVKVENLEGLERKLTLALAWDDVNEQVTARLKQMQKKAKVQGFRPGKAPLKMVESMYGQGAREEVLNEKLQRDFYDVVVGQKIRVAGYPRFDAQETQDDEKVFKVDAVFEVYPEITVGDLSAKEVEKVVANVGDAEIDQTIEILRKQRTRYNHVERAAQDGDRIIIDFVGKIDGEAFEGGSSENFPFVLGQGQMLPEFEAGLIGMKQGESKDVEVSFPEDYHGKDVAGKTAVFTLTMQNVSEAALPEVDADFAKALGIEDGDVAKMRAEVEKNVAREVKRRTEDKTKENVMQALLDVTEITVPKALVAEETSRLMGEMRQNFINQGMDANSLPDFPVEMFAAQAERRVSLGLILAQLVEDNKLEPKPEQVEAVIAEFAESYEDPKEVIDWYKADAQRMQGPSSLAVEANVVAFVLGQAKAVEKAMSFDDIMAAQQGAM